MSVGLRTQFWALLAASFLTSACGTLPKSTPLAGGPLTAAPAGFSELCETSPEECTSGPATTQAETVLTLDHTSLGILDRVNRTVNAEVRPMTDMDLYGEAERWSLPARSGNRAGDCEDYALEKRRRLIAAGLPAQAFSLAVVDSRETGPHVVLLVGTDRGDFVLDNLDQWVLPWSKTGYRWVQRQVPTAQLKWARLDLEYLSDVEARRATLIASGSLYLASEGQTALR